MDTKQDENVEEGCLTHPRGERKLLIVSQKWGVYAES